MSSHAVKWSMLLGSILIGLVLFIASLLYAVVS